MELVPIYKVLDDMYDPNGGPVAWAARDYYYHHYATDEERKEMDREDRIATISGWAFRFMIAIYAVWSVIDFLATY